MLFAPARPICICAAGVLQPSAGFIFAAVWLPVYCCPFGVTLFTRSSVAVTILPPFLLHQVLCASTPSLLFSHRSASSPHRSNLAQCTVLLQVKRLVAAGSNVTARSAAAVRSLNRQLVIRVEVWAPAELLFRLGFRIPLSL